MLPGALVATLTAGLLALPLSAPAQSPANSRDPISHRKPLRNALVGAGIGAASGALFGATAPESCCVPFGWSREEAVLLWGGATAGAGAFIGLGIGQLGSEPLPTWKAALIGGGMGGALAAIPASQVGDAGYVVALGAGGGILIGAVVGVLGQADHSNPAIAGGQVILTPSPKGLVIGWRHLLGR